MRQQDDPPRREATAVGFTRSYFILTLSGPIARCKSAFPPDAPSYLDALGVRKWRFDPRLTPLEVPENGCHVPHSRGFALPDPRIFAKMGDSEPPRCKLLQTR
jgi:hypothetical protein